MTSQPRTFPGFARATKREGARAYATSRVERILPFRPRGPHVFASHVTRTPPARSPRQFAFSGVALNVSASAPRD